MKALGVIVIVLVFSFVLLPRRSAYCLNGYIETHAIHFPHSEDIFESRNRLLLEESADVKDWIAFYLSGRLDGLLSNREGDANDITGKIDDAHLNFYFPKAEVTLGYSKVFWGKLDQLAPTDIVNPLDISRVFLEAERKEAKLAVPLFMISPRFGQESRLDLILVPFFEEGIYDEFNEKTSPFNVVDFPAPLDQLPVEEELPSRDLENMEYGGRFSSTFREVDWSLYYFRGFCDFPLYRLTYRFNPILNKMAPDKIKAEYRKNTMFGYDFEFVEGKWGIRGEGAFFADQGFQKEGTVDYAKGDSFTGGFGVDRNFGDNYLNLSALYGRIFVDDDIEERKEEITLLATMERRFSYETKAVKLFSVYNTRSNSVFLRATLSINLLENLWADLSIGLFDGSEKDTLSKFKDSDFVCIKCKYNL